MLYFAYGSNVWQPRLEERLGPCPRVGTAWLEAHILRFHKDGRDGSGKCDIRHTGHPEHRVYGVIFELSEEQKRRLDVFEGCDYVTYEVPVQSTAGALEVFAYQALERAVDPNAKPFSWYKALVLKGALEAGFPDDYLDSIRAVEAVLDSDSRRHDRHIRLLEGSAREPAPAPARSRARFGIWPRTDAGETEIP